MLSLAELFTRSLVFSAAEEEKRRYQELHESEHERRHREAEEKAERARLKKIEDDKLKAQVRMSNVVASSSKSHSSARARTQKNRQTSEEGRPGGPGSSSGGSRNQYHQCWCPDANRNQAGGAENFSGSSVKRCELNLLSRNKSAFQNQPRLAVQVQAQANR